MPLRNCSDSLILLSFHCCFPQKFFFFDTLAAFGGALAAAFFFAADCEARAVFCLVAAFDRLAVAVFVAAPAAFGCGFLCFFEASDFFGESDFLEFLEVALLALAGLPEVLTRFADACFLAGMMCLGPDS